MKTADTLLQELGELLSLPDLRFDDKRLCYFLLNGKYRISLLANSKETLFIYALLGGWPQTLPENFSVELMTASLMFSTVNGPYIGYDPLSKTLLLAKSFPLAKASAPALKKTVEELTQHQAHILEVLHTRSVPLPQPPLLVANMA